MNGFWSELEALAASRAHTQTFQALDKIAVEIRCKNCKSLVKADEKECPVCGHKLDTAEVDASADTPEGEKTAAPLSPMQWVKGTAGLALPVVGLGAYWNFKRKRGQNMEATGEYKTAAARKGNPIVHLRKGRKSRQIRALLEKHHG